MTIGWDGAGAKSELFSSLLGCRKRDDIRQHTIRVGVGQSVCGILVHEQPAAGDEFVSGASGGFQRGRFVDVAVQDQCGCFDRSDLGAARSTRKARAAG
jgi:hypothetical protein